MNRLIKLSTIVYVILFSGCVAQKKFDDLLAERVKIEADYYEVSDKLDAANAKLERLEEQVSRLDEETAEKSQKINKLETDLAALQKEHDQLETYYNNLLTNSGKLSRDLAEQQERLLELQEGLDTKKKENEALLTDLVEREKKVSELERIIAEKDKAVQMLMVSVKEALLGFSGNELSVEIKNGKVYVSLAEQLLFKSGSYKVDPKGERALIQLAEALKTSPDINILVEGHTDNVPISSKSIKDNWDLSVLRATSITRILIRAGVNPGRITAAGRGEYQPVTSNATADGKQKNRRTEIILSPDLDELFELLKAN
ncbi:MAG: OmpA family protein [Bacteroidetes bacterium]|nr:OmpA family protein [Bacteroidota bacterium]